MLPDAMNRITATFLSSLVTSVFIVKVPLLFDLPILFVTIPILNEIDGRDSDSKPRVILQRHVSGPL